jgi:hypothetical protein
MIRYKSRQISALGSFLTLVLLLVYTAASLKLDSIHQLFHVENITELHSIEKESDPCHKNIYHQQKASGCEHKSHITENVKCPVCECNSNTKEIIPGQDEIIIHFKSQELKFFFKERNLSFCNKLISGRSPPRV